MHYVIYCMDDPSTPNARDQHYAEHRAHLAAATVKLLVCGPLTAVSSEKRVGSMLLVEADDISDVKAFAERDPFYVNRVWNDVQIHPFVKSTDNR
ncbi:YciI family protein [Paraburkholderia bannensis]|uniref:YciI family protein n=1 Tax=Paraburkholderia bannensis TaxID=765414 RepID=UPI002ABD97F7|nr:YciI family protein [Paraburkholderia bannensis]